MKINTHGLKMVGLETVAGESNRCTGFYGHNFFQLNYDRETGEVWTNEFCDIKSWVEYEDTSIVICGTIVVPTSAQKIADRVFNSVCDPKDIIW